MPYTTSNYNMAWRIYFLLLFGILQLSCIWTGISRFEVSSDFIEDIPYAFAMNLFPSSCAHILKFRSIHGISIQSFLHFLFFVSLIFRMVQFRYFIFSLTLSSMWSFLFRFLKGLLSFSTFFSVWIFSSIQILFSFLLLIHFHTYIHWVDTLILM